MKVRIGGRILMMKKVIIMTTNYIKRYAKDINTKNDISNFDELFPSVGGVSAVSWEWRGYSRREYGEKLLKRMYTAITNNSSDNIHLMVELVPEQPNTAIVNYKKTWGLIRGAGINIEDFWDKRSFIDKGKKGLVLTGTCCAVSSHYSEIQKLINAEEKLFFSNLPPDLSDTDAPQTERLTKWIKKILQNDGVIFFLLGRFDEHDSEVVAIGKMSVLKKIM